MENRFGIKDFFLFGLIGMVLIVLLLAMLQFDRQWKTIQRLEQQNTTLAGDLSRISDRIAQGGISLGAGSGENGSAVRAADAFEPLLTAEAMEDFARGGVYLDNFGTKIGRLTPLVSSDVYASWIELLVFEQLGQRNPQTLEIEPKLAESWEISDDGLTMTFKLRDRVRFSDGEPLTAEDVKFTFDFILNPEVQADRTRAYLDKLASVEVLDPRTVQFTFNEPYFLNFETVAGVSILPKHFYEKYTPLQFNESIGLVMGSGQYMLPSPTDWTPAEDVTLVRNPRYWGVPGTFDRMVFKQIQEEAAEAALFNNQELDVFRTPPELYEKLHEDPRILSFAEPMTYDTPFGGYRYIGWNQEKRTAGTAAPTVFADPKVRRAMTMLINRQRIVDDLLYGYAKVATGPFAPTSPQSDPSIEAWPYDVEAAKTLLAESGWVDRDGDGVLENEQGQPLRFKLMYPGGSDFWEKLALFLRDNFAAGGVLMEPERQDWPVLVDRLNKSDFEAVALGWSGSVESDPYQIFSSAQAKVGGDNRTGYRSERLDAAIEDARTTIDLDARMQKWHEVHRILHEDQPYTFLFNGQALRLFNNRLKNVQTSPLGLNYEFLNGGVLPWYIPAAQQTRTN